MAKEALRMEQPILPTLPKVALLLLRNYFLH